MEVQKALGVVWDSPCDNIRGWQGQATWRTILSYVSSLFDPPGLFAQVLLTAKRPLQELCGEKANWEEELASKKTCLGELATWPGWVN
ncbi:hypothetical protein EG68_09157 [Paragonimus skrjabini miyazakii]|uniref:Uncharacterized protein n=1 Tax=Paragonimus skrjabini miyazakii TaxID=59628 RepID=A0A8S9YLZ1_9TREM|nr:hypothetical protein EG68_09157 [Paragonimus skrjabini miyazakii]